MRAPLMLALVLGFALVAALPAQDSKVEPTTFALALPVAGLATVDATPNACVDCHTQRGEVDFRLSTRLGAFTMGAPDKVMQKARATVPDRELGGWHPAIKPESFQNIPSSCLRCHRQDSPNAPPFSRLIHVLDLTEESFTRQAGGGCGSCHKLDSVTGQWSIPSAAEK